MSKTPKNNVQVSLLTEMQLLQGGQWQKLTSDRKTLPGATSNSEATLGYGTCRRHMVVVSGSGKRKFPFPSVDELVSGSIGLWKELLSAGMVQFRHVLNETGKRTDDLELVIDKDALQALPLRKQNFIPSLDSSKPNDTGATVWAVASAIGNTMYRGRFDAHIAEQFDNHFGKLAWAQKHMSGKYQKAIKSLKEHFQELRSIYKEALPRVIHALAAEHANVSEDDLINLAVLLLNKQLSQILQVLGIWTDCFGQRRDGLYTELDDVIFMVEQAFHLFTMGDEDTCGPECKEKIRVKTSTMKVGDVFVARFGHDGPATIPGGRGPVGAHAIEWPYTMRDLTVCSAPILFHEYRHDYYYNVIGLPKESVKNLLSEIDRDHEAGKYTFSSDKIKIGNQSVDTIQLLKQIFVNTLSESDADIAGGVLLSGPAFYYSMIPTFAALNSRAGDILSTRRPLRNRSIYVLSENNQLVFAPHMPDYARAYVVAAALDLLGFNSDAEECRQLADQMAGVPIPEYISWFNGDPESSYRPEIKVPFKDLIQLAPTVANAIINGKLNCLGGLSTSQLVNWNARRQAKVIELAKILMEGRSDVPESLGDVYATYIGAAAITAVWGLVKAGAHPLQTALPMVETNARLMLQAIRARQAEQNQLAAEEEQQKLQAGPSGNSPVVEVEDEDEDEEEGGLAESEEEESLDDMDSDDEENDDPDADDGEFEGIDDDDDE